MTTEIHDDQSMLVAIGVKKSGIILTVFSQYIQQILDEWSTSSLEYYIHQDKFPDKPGIYLWRGKICANSENPNDVGWHGDFLSAPMLELIKFQSPILQSA